MTNQQIKAIKDGQQVRALDGRIWIACHDAFVPERDTVNAQVAVCRGSMIRHLTCESTEF